MVGKLDTLFFSCRDYYRAMVKTLCLLCLCVFTLQGCLINRLSESKNELCQKPENRIYPIIKDTITIVFETPILYPEDIVTILDAPPSRKKHKDDRLIYYYHLANKIEPSKRFNIPITFEFIQEGKKYKLAKVEVQKNIQDLLPNVLIKQIFAAICTAERDYNKVTVSLEKIEQSLLPNRKTVKALLGTPRLNNNDTITFLYRLNNHDHTANISIYFDSQSDIIRGVDLTFFRYHLAVDMNKNQAIGRFKSWKTLIGFGFATAFSF